MDENELSYIIRGAIFKVYRELGSGMFESVYESALAYQLNKDGLIVQQQVPVEVSYDGVNMGVGFRLDMIVNNKVILELKSVEQITDAHHKQLLTYLKLTGKKLGLLVNFNTDNVNNSIIRKVNGL